MPKKYNIGCPPAGYALTGAASGEEFVVETTSFTSSEDGNDFISRLEVISSFFGDVYQHFGISPSCVDNYLALVNKFGDATVYCNELQILAKCRRKAPLLSAIPTGTPVTVNDIAEVEEIHLKDAEGISIELSKDVGVVFLLSYRWRKGLYYDFFNLRKDGPPRDYKLEPLFGSFMTRLMFQEMYSTNEVQWNRLFEWGWFPFVGLLHEDRTDLLNMALQGKYFSSHLEEICRHFTSSLRERVATWVTQKYYTPHKDFIDIAVRHYENADYPSCISILNPRIEGVLRYMMDDQKPSGKATTKGMVETLVGNLNNNSIMLPERFQEYLRQVHFRGFDLSKGEVELSRHSHCHGVSMIGEYDMLRASVGFMILDQIHYYLSRIT